MTKHAAKLKTVDVKLSSQNIPRSSGPENRLSTECSVYTRYLANQEPDAYIQKKYAEAFEPGRPLAIQSGYRFEVLIEKISIKNPILTRAIDGYCKVLYRKSIVRKKLVLLLAILETQAMSVQKIDVADAMSPPVLLLTFLTQITRSVLLLLTATILLSPVRLAMRCFDRANGT